MIDIACLIAGSRLLLTSAVSLAEHFGLSQAIIGLTLVAVGTSLSELSISVLAAALLMFFFLYTSQRVTKSEGGVLLIGYLAYLGSGFFIFSN